MIQRRSFLALIAGALALSPEDLSAIAASATKGNLPFPEQHWYRPWVIEDHVTLEPGRETRDVLFGPPVPNFIMRSMGWGGRPDILAADLVKIVDSLECRLICDGLDVMALPIHGLGYGRCGFEVTPSFAVSGDDFRLEVDGHPIDLTAPQRLTFWISGVLGVCENPPRQSGHPRKKTKATG